MNGQGDNYFITNLYSTACISSLATRVQNQNQEASISFETKVYRRRIGEGHAEIMHPQQQKEHKIVLNRPCLYVLSIFTHKMATATLMQAVLIATLQMHFKHRDLKYFAQSHAVRGQRRF